MDVHFTGVLGWVFVTCVSLIGCSVIILGTWCVLNYFVWEILVNWSLRSVNGGSMRIWQDDENDYLWSINDFNAIRLDYIHELQNLYYTLTKTELIYNQ